MATPPTPQPARAPDLSTIRLIGTTGNSVGGINQPGFSINSDTRGLLEGTWVGVFQVDPSLPRLPNVPRRGEGHPFDARLKCYKVDASFGNNAECRVTASYIGLEKDPTEPQIELTAATSETSIVFHPGFEGWAIKTPAVKGSEGKKPQPVVYQDHIETDDRNNFVRFKIGVSPNDFGGVESYLTPRLTARVTYYTGRTLGVKKAQGVGKASKYPGAFPKMLLDSTSATWLLTNASVSEYGNVYKISEEWMLSESGKPWNPNIYQTFGAGGGEGYTLGGTNFVGQWTGIDWGSVGPAWKTRL
jgi:hypothetical protein